MITPPPIQTPALEPAANADVESIARLLEGCAPETVTLEADEIRGQLDRFSVLRSEVGQVVGVAALHPVGPRLVELRSVAVDPAVRGRGLGRTLVEHVVREGLEPGQQLFCYTFRPSFFHGLGFRVASAARLPEREGRPRRLGGRERLAMELLAPLGESGLAS